MTRFVLASLASAPAGGFAPVVVEPAIVIEPAGTSAAVTAR
jgi:hypothetical protein